VKPKERRLSVTEKAKIATWAKELDGTATPGDEAEIPGGLREVFTYLAEIDWTNFRQGLSQVQAAGFRVKTEGLQMMVLIKPEEA
jgi:hypothetical protein